jgi:hypothetical protein
MSERVLWEYKVVLVDAINDLQTVLNAAGEEGWELVQYYSSRLILKRPKEL